MGRDQQQESDEPERQKTGNGILVKWRKHNKVDQSSGDGKGETGK